MVAATETEVVEANAARARSDPALTGRSGRGRPEPAQTESPADFDLGGVVGVRLWGASSADVAAVRGQLGPLDARLSRAPEIEIQFVERLETPRRMQLLDADDVGFTDDDFFVFGRRRGRRSVASIPFADVGGPCRIVCESGAGGVPFLVPIVNLTALARGVLPLHASSFVYEGTGAVVTGWAKGGKTEALLAFMARGARYVADEWTYLDRNRVFGLPEPIKLWNWHLRDLPEYRDVVGRSTKARLRAIGVLASMDAAVPRRLESGSFGRFLDRAVPLAKRQLHVRVPPAKLFGPTACITESRLDKIIFVGSHADRDIVAAPADTRDVARRMLFSLQYERHDFLSCYSKFRFAFPEAANETLEGAAEVERSLLERQLEGRAAYSVRHPFPVHIPALFDAIRPLLVDG